MTSQINNQPNWIFNFDRQGRTPLDKAAAAQDQIQTNFLLKQLFGENASFHFIDSTLEPLRKQYGELDASIQEKRSASPHFSPPLHKAAFKGDLAEIKKNTFPEKLEIADSKGLTPLHYAILGKQKETISHLIGQANLTLSTLSGDSYLHYAAMTGDPEILELFLGKISASHANAKGQTAAHAWAAVSGDLKTLKKIVDAGAPFNAEHPRILSPVGVLILRAMEKHRSPVNGNDIALLVLNLARLFVTSEMSRVSYSHSPGLFGSGNCTISNMLRFKTMSIARNVLGLAKRQLVQNMVPADQKGIRSFVASPLAGLVAAGADVATKSKNSHASFFSAVSSLAAATIVAENGIKSLSRRENATLAQKIVALPIHGFNTGCALFDVLLNLESSVAYSPSFLRCEGPVDDFSDFRNANDFDNFEDSHKKTDDSNSGSRSGGSGFNFKFYEYNSKTGRFEETTPGGSSGTGSSGNQRDPFEDFFGGSSGRQNSGTGGSGNRRDPFEEFFRNFGKNAGGGGSYHRSSGGGASANSDECVSVSASSYTNKSVLDRLLDPTLTKNLGTTTTDLFGRAFVDPVCKENYGIILDPKTPPADCPSAKKAYKKLALEAHPDKCEKALNDTEKCNAAFANLANALAVFCPKNMSPDQI